ncbi:hypothetical protein G7066_11195 [Leucobacter coleopterorum]|uniref:FxLD family lantipeptide n=1 Tax=Leucobacter coleopterorum TaxID=2714933 RepID=A0ABX6JXF7_9MICO|nr:hypothetical protein [Leucobacter coleopterorum]QIM18999.1 hypothetical protein G7066_11195 [Leucobacter coleopterorum]
MTEQKNTVDTKVATETTPVLNPEAGLASAADFASAETQEILNLLGDSEGGACCGGGCCSI